MDYATWVANLSNEMVVDADFAPFVQILPACEEYASNRIYRELDLLSTVTRQTGALTVGTRTFNLPTASGRFVVTNGFNVITPSGQTTPDNGTRNPLVPTTRDVLDMIWPSTSGAALPTLYAMITDQQIIVGPAPDAAYTIECIGTIRPAPLSASNTTTFLSLYLPDLFNAASMVFMTGFQRNWGAQADDPKMAVSWSNQYDTLFASANVENMRAKYQSGAWGSLQPTPIATPTR